MGYSKLTWCLIIGMGIIVVLTIGIYIPLEIEQYTEKLPFDDPTTSNPVHALECDDRYGAGNWTDTPIDFLDIKSIGIKYVRSELIRNANGGKEIIFWLCSPKEKI